MATPQTGQIRNYNLFGETGELPDVVHCELIAVRSRLHNWEFAPHRHARLHQILLVEAGGGRADLEGRSHALGAGRIVNVPVGAVHAFSFSAGTQGWVVTLGAEFLDDSLRDSEGLRAVLARPAIARGNAQIRTLMELIFAEFGALDYARAHVLRSLSGVLIGRIARLLSATSQPSGTAEGGPLLRRFEHLIDAHFLDHLSVGDYAARLAVTPGHLSRMMRRATGKPASRLIEERLVREARRYLAYTNLPVLQIAYALGFADPAYFSRVFSRAAGTSPRAFRARLETSA